MTDAAAELGTSEHEALEFKRDMSNRDAVRTAICALANDLPGRGGGTLLVGVRDDGTPHGLTVDDESLTQVVNLRDEASILPRPVIRVTSAQFAGQPVIRIDVTASDSPPARFKGVVYVRVGPTSRRAHIAEERVLAERAQHSATSYDQTPVRSASTDDLDTEFFALTYLPAAVAPEVLAENKRSRTEQLASLRMTTTAGSPTVAGLVVLGLDPGAHVYGAYVQFVRYGGTTVAADVLDHAELRGNLRLVLRDLESRLRSLITTTLLDVGEFRQVDVSTYPYAALRELAVNALVHRSYESNAPVRVLWFDDRVEIDNPGGPYGRVTDANFESANDYRNPTLAEAAKNLGYINQFGRGVAFVGERLQANGNPAAEFAIDPFSWAVTVRAGR